MTSSSSNDMTRRAVLTTVALGSAALLGSCTSAAPASAEPPRSQTGTNLPGASSMSNTPALAGKHEVAPLPFAPGSLNGLSERLITSHHENNYGGAVKNLNRVEQELAKLSSDTPPFIVAALRERELTFRNIDFAAAVPRYIDAFFANVNWEEVNRRFERAQRVSAIYRGASS
jgi:superoxide dismutase, Fe-Mn family